MNKEKIREERIFEIIYCPFEGRPKLHHLCQPNGLVGRYYLGSNSKGQCTISKILFSLLLYTFTEQNIFFSETCFAYPISEQEFTVCVICNLKLKVLMAHFIWKNKFLPKFKFKSLHLKFAYRSSREAQQSYTEYGQHFILYDFCQQSTHQSCACIRGN